MLTRDIRVRFSCFVLKRLFLQTKLLSGKLTGYAESGHLYYDLITLCSEHLLTFFQFQAPDIRHWEGHSCDTHTNSCQSYYNYVLKVIQILVPSSYRYLSKVVEYVSSCGRG